MNVSRAHAAEPAELETLYSSTCGRVRGNDQGNDPMRLPAADHRYPSGCRPLLAGSGHLLWGAGTRIFEERARKAEESLRKAEESLRKAEESLRKGK